MRLTIITIVALSTAFAASRSGPPTPDPVQPPALREIRYESDRAMLRGEFAQFKDKIVTSSGTSIYTAYELGYPLVKASFRSGDTELKRDILRHAADLLRDLPTYGSLVAANRGYALEEAIDRISPQVASARARIGGDAARFDGLPLPQDEWLYRYRIFPLKSGDVLQINTGNILQFGHYLSTLVRLASADPAIAEDVEAQRDLQTIAQYLTDDYLRFFWQDAPAWHWSGPYAGGIRERTADRLAGGVRMANRRFFRGFLDYDVHLMAVAADLQAASGHDPRLAGTRADRELVGEIGRATSAILRLRVDTGPDGREFAFDRGFWDDNPIAQYAGCKQARLPAAPCPISRYTTDISHAQRWPAWLESFGAAARDPVQRQRIETWRRNLAQQVGANIRYVGGKPLLTNFLDGRDGWFLTTESKEGQNAHPPSSLTGWAMRYGAFAPLGELDPRVAEAQRRFCDVIASSFPDDVQFRTNNYGEPEANPANGIRPPHDEYGADSVYAHICRMAEIIYQF